MSTIALARKWRPRTFSELVGQEHLNKALINSLNHQRLHHAYLFTGTRGVGKTSVARLLAKALNCEQGISSSPCLQCAACTSIEQGRFMDLIEIDAASRTRVEDTREILENVQYMPTHGRFKIYLIDEVHMLSQHSFNALLKTLEEPPMHVKFLLATTDPKKIPITVLSRCLQFHLKQIDPVVIQNRLELILKEEHISYDMEALEIIAKAAFGSMRDALSILDQVIASLDEHLTTKDVKDCLGMTQHDYALQLLQALAAMMPEKLIQISRQIAAEGGHFNHVLDELLSDLHQISLNQMLPTHDPLLQADKELLHLATLFSKEDVQLFYQIALKGLQDLPTVPTPIVGFEMTLLRMLAFKPRGQISIDPSLHQTPAVLLSEEAKPTTPSTETLGWSDLISRLNLDGLSKSAIQHTEFVSQTDTNITLRTTHGHQSLFTKAVIHRIEESLRAFHQKKLKLTILTDEVHSTPSQEHQKNQQIKIETAKESLQGDLFFQQLQEKFSAELVKNSITSLKDDL